MLSVDRLSVKYVQQDNYALKDLSLDCDLTGITALVGRSGVGKTTLIAMMAGIYRPDDPLFDNLSGSIRLNGNSPSALRGAATISWVPQEPVLLDHLTVMKNVLLPLTLGESARVGVDPAHADELLTELGLDAYRKFRPKELSGGMKARVSFARALVSKPTYLFLDEPFLGLDLMNRWNIYGLIRKLRSREGLATILTSHNIPEVVVLSDRIVVLSECGGQTSARVIENEATLSASMNPRSCLTAARSRAAPIEYEVFFGLEPRYA